MQPIAGQKVSACRQRKIRSQHISRFVCYRTKNHLPDQSVIESQPSKRVGGARRRIADTLPAVAQMYDESKLNNRLLKRLPPDILNSIYSSLEPVTLERGQVIVRANQPIDYLYFLCGGISSVIAVTTRGQLAEAGMVGREGFSPTSGAVGATTSIHEVIMQVSGYGYRIAVSAAQAEINRNSVFASLLARYIQTFASQVSYTVWANVNLHIHERLARWLLMSHDRVDGDEIILTHDFIALMLGVRRPSITTGLHLLEGKKLVRSERGRITIRDRRGLEDFAGEAYGKPEEEYSQLFGPQN